MNSPSACLVMPARRARSVILIPSGSALCAIPFEALEGASNDEQTTAMFAARMRLTRAMLDLASP
jgi:hypothetical protein